MSLLARASHGFVAPVGTGEDVVILQPVPQIVEGLVGVLVEEDEPILGGLVDEEVLAGAVFEESVPIADLEDEELMSGTIVTEEPMTGVFDDE